MTEMKASLKLDLYGNMIAQSQVYARKLNQLTQSGSRSMMMLSKSAQLAGQGLDKLGNRYTAALTGAGAVMAAKNVSSLHMRLTRLGIQAGRTDKEMEILNNQIFRTSQMKDINIDPSQLFSAVEKIVSKTGDLKFAEENLENFAYTISATGSAGEDIGAMGADLMKKFGIKDADLMIAKLGKLANQGKEGAFELRDLASQGERITAAYASTGRTGSGAVDEMGAMIQMVIQGTGTAEQAATAFDALIRNFSDVSKQKMLKGKIKIFEDDDPNKMRSIIDISKDLIKLTNGNTTKIGSVIDNEGMKALRAMIIEYNDTKGFSTVDKYLNSGSDSAQLLKDSARAAAELDSNISKLKASFRQFAYDKLAQPLNRLANAINAVDQAKMQQYLGTATKVATGVGAALLAYKTAKFGVGAYNFFKNPTQAVRGNGLDAMASMSAPMPVYVVNAGAMGGGAGGLLGGGKGKLGKLGKFAKYGGRALGVAGIAYSAYELTQAENKAQMGASIGGIAGSIIGAAAGPLGMVAGAYIGNYLGEKVGSMFDYVPENKVSLLASERSATPWAKTESTIHLAIDEVPERFKVKLQGLKTNDSPENMTKLDLSLGGRSFAR